MEDLTQVNSTQEIVELGSVFDRREHLGSTVDSFIMNEKNGPCRIYSTASTSLFSSLLFPLVYPGVSIFFW